MGRSWSSLSQNGQLGPSLGAVFVKNVWKSIELELHKSLKARIFM